MPRVASRGRVRRGLVCARLGEEVRVGRATLLLGVVDLVGAIVVWRRRVGGWRERWLLR